jgi:acyl-CoA dehydrogenase
MVRVIDYTQCMAWEFETDHEFQQQLDWMNEVVRSQIWPLEPFAADLAPEQLDRAFEGVKGEAKERGLWAAHLPPELGGSGFGQVRLGLMQEILGTSALAPMAFGCQPPDSGNSEILALAGTDAQKQAYLFPLLDGRLRSGFSMTEPNTAGSDPTTLATRAVRDGNDYVIDGHKWFTTNASVADFLIVMAVTDPDTEPHRRASMFLVDAGTPGLEVVRDIPTMAEPAVHAGHLNAHCEVVYSGVRVPASALLGGEGDGFAIAQQRLGPGRIHHCMRWLGQARRAFDMLCERATYRQTHGKVLGEHQTVQNWIADSLAEMTAARLMTLNAAWIMDTHGAAAARQEIAMIKYFGAKVLHDVIDRAVQAHGALGFSTDMPLEQMYRSARAARIYDGPDEVHRQSVARRVLRGYKPPANGVPSEYVPARRADGLQRFADLLDLAAINR